jgi:hypothetical protein
MVETQVPVLPYENDVGWPEAVGRFDNPMPLQVVEILAYFVWFARESLLGFWRIRRASPASRSIWPYTLSVRP